MKKLLTIFLLFFQVLVVKAQLADLVWYAEVTNNQSGCPFLIKSDSLYNVFYSSNTDGKIKMATYSEDGAFLSEKTMNTILDSANHTILLLTETPHKNLILHIRTTKSSVNKFWVMVCDKYGDFISYDSISTIPNFHHHYRDELYVNNIKIINNKKYLSFTDSLAKTILNFSTTIIPNATSNCFYYDLSFFYNNFNGVTNNFVTHSFNDFHIMNDTNVLFNKIKSINSDLFVAITPNNTVYTFGYSNFSSYTSNFDSIFSINKYYLGISNLDYANYLYAMKDNNALLGLEYVYNFSFTMYGYRLYKVDKYGNKLWSMGLPNMQYLKKVIENEDGSIMLLFSTSASAWGQLKFVYLMKIQPPEITGIKDNSTVNEKKTASYHSIYPNPTNGKIFINGFQPIKSVKVYDLLGRMVESKENINSEITNISINGVSGIYIVEIINENNTIERYKIMKE